MVSGDGCFVIRVIACVRDVLFWEMTIWLFWVV